MAIWQVLLGIFLVLWGLTFLLPIHLPPVILGVLAVVTGILVIVGR